jgi:peptidoglycan/LPS O-acetylase OafA/YrhL
MVLSLKFAMHHINDVYLPNYRRVDDFIASNKLAYMIQLDSLRALAAFSVLFFHFYLKDQNARESIIGKVPWGEWGVHLFFVLSGFLITGILLRCREASEQGASRLHQLKQFYVRRSLRIFPLFYFVTLGAALLNVEPLRETLLWHLTYTSNFYFASIGKFEGPASHFWSLAVEEQFYLVWPFLILFLPRKYLGFCIFLVIIAAPVYRILGAHFGISILARSNMMVACLDLLGLGSLLAYYNFSCPFDFYRLGKSKLYKLLGIALFVFALSLIFKGSASRASVVSNMVVTPMFFAWLIHQAAVGFTGFVGRILETKSLVYCGKISYGIYIYHPFVSVLVGRVLDRLGISLPRNAFAEFLLLTIITLLVSSVSWFLLEARIVKLKKRFEYQEAVPI